MLPRTVARCVAIGLFASVAAVTLPGGSAQAVSAAPDVFAFGRASFYGSAAGGNLSQPITGITGTATGHGYWLVASDGGIFSFGDAHFYGSTGAIPLNRPIVGIAATATGHGYWLVASDGRVFKHGDATIDGSVPPAAFIDQSIAGIAASHKHAGFWLVARAIPRWNANVERAIDWFKAHQGNRAYEGLCEEAVEMAYGTIRRYPTAFNDWLAQRDRHPDWLNAPRGALVFYKPPIYGTDGHVAISLGNGYVTSTGIDHRIGVTRIDSFPNPLGWAEEPW